MGFCYDIPHVLHIRAEQAFVAQPSGMVFVRTDMEASEIPLGPFA